MAWRIMRICLGMGHHRPSASAPRQAQQSSEERGGSPACHCIRCSVDAAHFEHSTVALPLWIPRRLHGSVDTSGENFRNLANLSFARLMRWSCRRFGSRPVRMEADLGLVLRLFFAVISASASTDRMRTKCPCQACWATSSSMQCALKLRA